MTAGRLFSGVMLCFSIRARECILGLFWSIGTPHLKVNSYLWIGSLLEWKGLLNRNVGFFLDMATLVMALGHYLHIWWLHGVAFHLVDAVLFLNIRVCLLIGFLKNSVTLQVT